MAFRIGEHIVAGRLDNSQRHSVHGVLVFGEHRQVNLSLVGDLAGDLAGKVIEFEVPRNQPVDDATYEEYLKELQLHQVGAAGDIHLKIARVPRCSISDFVRRSKLGEQPPLDDLPCLYMEWYSQNGRMVAEIIDPQIEEQHDDDAEEEITASEITAIPLTEPFDEPTTPEITGVELDEFGNAHSFDASPIDNDEEDPYGLFPHDIQQQLGDSEEPRPWQDEFGDDTNRDPLELRDWSEVIPDIDPETKAQYEKWDEIYGGHHNQSLNDLFDPPLQLPPGDEVNDEETARPLVLMIAGRLAMLSVAFDLCKHFNMVRAYRWLVNDVLPEAEVHPDQLEHGIVTHYSSWEYCEHCDAEMDAEDERAYGGG